MSIVTSDFVNVLISSSDDPNIIERRFQKGLTIEALKQKMEILTGASSSTMKLSLYDRNDSLICKLDQDDALLGSYPVDDKMRIHVEDQFLLKKQIEEDTDPGTKFELSDEAYAKRQETLQAYLKNNKLGKYNKEEMEKREAEKEKEKQMEEEKIKSITVGSRCQVSVPDHPIRRATVKYAGEVKFASGLWVGVQYDEPMGKNDGSVKGVRYFECPPKYGGFVKPLYVEVGDFPEEEINFDDEL